MNHTGQSDGERIRDLERSVQMLAQAMERLIVSLELLATVTMGPPPPEPAHTAH